MDVLCRPHSGRPGEGSEDGVKRIMWSRYVTQGVLAQGGVGQDHVRQCLLG